MPAECVEGIEDGEDAPLPSLPAGDRCIPGLEPLVLAAGEGCREQRLLARVAAVHRRCRDAGTLDYGVDWGRMDAMAEEQLLGGVEELRRARRADATGTEQYSWSITRALEDRFLGFCTSCPSHQVPV